MAATSHGSLPPPPLPEIDGGPNSPSVLDVASRFCPKLIGSGCADLWKIHGQTLLPSSCRECPITLRPIYKPVLLCDGAVFEQNAILQWLQKSDKSPCTNLPLKHKAVLALDPWKETIEHFLRQKDKHEPCTEKALLEQAIRDATMLNTDPFLHVQQLEVLIQSATLHVEQLQALIATAKAVALQVTKDMPEINARRATCAIRLQAFARGFLARRNTAKRRRILEVRKFLLQQPKEGCCFSSMPSKFPQALEKHFEQITDHGDLGQGSFAIVRRLRDKRDQRIFALKVMEKAPMMIRNMVQQIHTEVKIQAQCKHPNIVRMFDFLEDDTHVYMLLECVATGGLPELMGKSPEKRLSEVIAGWVFGQVVDGVAYLHREGFIHRDLKPENILIDVMFVAKLCDFGWSANLGESSTIEFCGNLDYIAPEVLMGKSRIYGIGLDLWSLGVLLYEMLCGCSPFRADKSRCKLEEFVSRVLALKYPFPPWLSNEACHLICHQLQLDASTRLPTLQMLQHPWLIKYYDGPMKQNAPPCTKYYDRRYAPCRCRKCQLRPPPPTPQNRSQNPTRR
eukprot:gnl/MRDRNA2_/MRDRNA2_35005_c0_seq1.p1 gnl/MRDRNA2_/MRDRNA2_35005_c0~~gnl/MRDRNA2_/MRDRNA2_35005_c0_seq1.p1  ORF type:complete len:589 (+),score=87.75 gnl/MRDRNA2_/MRDRNA2_35005_c0_seq1:70-1767(+)